MKYLKRYRLFETVQNLLSELDTSVDDLQDIFQDLIDEGYKFSVSDIYLTKQGIKKTGNILQSHIPCLVISLKRDINKKDIKNWNDGIYYENDLAIINLVQNCIGRLQSTFGGDSEVLYSISNINDISIRICMGTKATQVSLDFNKFREFIRNLTARPRDNFRRIVKNDVINGYNINLHGTKEFHIYPDDGVSDRVLNGDIDTNIPELVGFSKDFMKHIYNKCIELSSNKDLWSFKESGYEDERVGIIYYNNIEFIRFEMVISHSEKVNVTIPSGSIFKRDKRKSVWLCELYLKIKFIK